MRSKAKPESLRSPNGPLLVKRKKWDPAKEPSWKKKTAEDRKSERLRALLKVLDIPPHKLALAPRFSNALAQAKGGLPAVLQAMRQSPEPMIQAFLEKWDELSPAQQKILPWEAIAMRANVDGMQLLGTIIMALRQSNANVVNVIALTNHPDTVRARVKAAKSPSGVKDRNALDLALGFMPRPKNSVINLSFPGQRAEIESTDAELLPGDIDVNEWMPNLTETQKLIGGE